MIINHNVISLSQNGLEFFDLASDDDDNNRPGSSWMVSVEGVVFIGFLFHLMFNGYCEF